MQTAELINRGTPTVAGHDRHRRRHEPDLPGRREIPSAARAPPIRTALGTIPAACQAARRDASPDTDHSTMSLPPPNPKPAPGPRSSVQVASAGSSGGFFGDLFGSKSDGPERGRPPHARGRAGEAETDAAREARPTRSLPRSPSRRRRAKRRRGRSRSFTAQARKLPPIRRQPPRRSLLSGAQPAVPSGGFDSRFGPWH